MVALAINYTLLIPIYLNWVVKLWADMEMYFGAFERIRYYIDNSGYREEHSLKKDMCKLHIIIIRFFEWKLIDKINFNFAGQPVPISWPQKGNIVYENVSLKYENQIDNIVSNLNLEIPTGQRVGDMLNRKLD